MEPPNRFTAQQVASYFNLSARAVRDWPQVIRLERELRFDLVKLVSEKESCTEEQAEARVLKWWKKYSAKN